VRHTPTLSHNTLLTQARHPATRAYSTQWHSKCECSGRSATLAPCEEEQTAQEQPPSAQRMLFLRPLEKRRKEKKEIEHVTGGQMGLCLPGVMGPGGEQTATACLNRKRGQPVPVRSHRAPQRRAEVHSLAALGARRPKHTMRT